MNRNLLRGLAIVLTVALMVGLAVALLPATAQAAGPGGHYPRYYPHQSHPMHYTPGSARWSTPGPPKVIVRDNGGDCDRWGYVRVGNTYKRFYNTCCRYGNSTRDYSVNPRQVWNTP